MQSPFWQRPLGPSYLVYTDGAHKGRWGSWAYVVLRKGKICGQASGRQRGQASSNQMEFRAVAEALALLPRDAKVRVFTDSRIIADAMNGHHQPKAFATEISNLEALAETKSVTWHWIKAHSGNELNERCDQLCVQAREGKTIVHHM